MIPRLPISTRTYTTLPYPTLDVDRLAQHRHRRFLHGLIMGRVGVAGIGDVLGGRAEFHCLRGLRNHRARQRGHDMDAEPASGLGVGAHRSAERRVGKEGVSTCRTRGAPYT